MAKVSLIITTFNRGTLLNYSLQRLTHLTTPDEIIIVDDGSSDNTPQVYENYKDKLPLKYIYNNNKDWSICSFARNIGVKAATGDLILTSEPELLWVTDIIPQMLKAKLDHPMDIINIGTIYHMQDKVVFNEIMCDVPKEYLSSVNVEEYQIEPKSYDQQGFVRTQNLQATFCCLYDKKWIEAVGGWDEDFPGAYGWDDIDLCTRLRIKEHVGQFNDLKMEAIHQWHPHLAPHIQGPMADANDKYFKAKDFENHPEQLISNQTHEWGKIKI